MNVLALTILISSCLAGIFIACFAAEIRRSRRSSPERDSLLPLDGGRILLGLMPAPLARLFARTERFGLLVVIGVLILLPLLLTGFDPLGWMVREVALPVLRMIFVLSGHGWGA